MSFIIHRYKAYLCYKCRYCKEIGHLQKFCQKRIANRAPQVDKFGNPFKATNLLDYDTIIQGNFFGSKTVSFVEARDGIFLFFQGLDQAFFGTRFI